MFGRSRLQGPSSSRRRGRIGVAISAALLVIGVFVAIPATATPVKYYTPTISPTCRDVNSSGALTITLTNNMAIGGQGFGSAQITVPQTWTNVTIGANPFSFVNPSTPRNWTAAKLTGSSSNIIQLTSASSADLVPPQGSVKFTFSATAPSAAELSTFNTAVKQSNNFLGSGNDFTLNKNPKATQPQVTVSPQCNAAPVASSVQISGTRWVGQVLTGTYAYTDAENDAQGTSTFRWLRNNVAIPGATSSTYTLVSDDAGQSIKFEVTPVASTGTSPGTAVQSSGVPINQFPVASSVTVSGTAHVGMQLTGSYHYSDNEGDSESGSTFAWLRNGVAISGASSSTYTLVPDDAGQNISFQVTPGAATGSSPGAPATSDPVTVTTLTTIPCDGTVVHVGDSDQVSITNLDSGNVGCQPVEITPTFSGHQLDVDKSNPNDQLNLLVQVDAFDPEPAANPVPVSQVSPPSPLHDGLWCNGSGTVADPYTEPTADNSQVPEVWCRESQTVVSYGPGGQGNQLMQVSETWLLQGDATLCRCK
jgi:hypothetical protein